MLLYISIGELTSYCNIAINQAHYTYSPYAILMESSKPQCIYTFWFYLMLCRIFSLRAFFSVVAFTIFIQDQRKVTDSHGECYVTTAKYVSYNFSDTACYKSLDKRHSDFIRSSKIRQTEVRPIIRTPVWQTLRVKSQNKYLPLVPMRCYSMHISDMSPDYLLVLASCCHRDIIPGHAVTSTYVWIGHVNQN